MCMLCTYVMHANKVRTTQRELLSVFRTIAAAAVAGFHVRPGFLTARERTCIFKWRTKVSETTVVVVVVCIALSTLANARAFS